MRRTTSSHTTTLRHMPLSPRGRVGLTRRLAAVLALVVGFVGFSPMLSQTSDATVGVDDYPAPAQGGAPRTPWSTRGTSTTASARRSSRGGSTTTPGRVPQLLPGRALGQRLELEVRRRRVRHPGRQHAEASAPSPGGRPGSPGSIARPRRLGDRVGTSSSITIEEYNYLSAGRYDQRTISTTSEHVAERLHPHRPHDPDQHERALDRPAHRRSASS